VVSGDLIELIQGIRNELEIERLTGMTLHFAFDPAAAVIYRLEQKYESLKSLFCVLTFSGSPDTKSLLGDMGKGAQAANELRELFGSRDDVDFQSIRYEIVGQSRLHSEFHLVGIRDKHGVHVIKFRYIPNALFYGFLGSKIIEHNFAKLAKVCGEVIEPKGIVLLFEALHCGCENRLLKRGDEPGSNLCALRIFRDGRQPRFRMLTVGVEVSARLKHIHHVHIDLC